MKAQKEKDPCKRETKRTVYDGLDLTARGLTVIIALGLLTLCLIMIFGYITGNFGRRPESEQGTEILQNTAFWAKNSEKNGKINLWLIDKAAFSYYNKGIGFAAWTPQR